jgi:hypothetical protein
MQYRLHDIASARTFGKASLFEHKQKQSKADRYPGISDSFPSKKILLLVDKFKNLLKFSFY